MSAYPMRKRVTLKYFDLVQINPGLGVVGKHIFNLNSAFSPDYTGTGHQPMSFDQYAAQYGHYTVLNTTYKVQFWGGSGSYRIGTLVARDPAIGWSSLDAIEEQPFVKLRTLYATQTDHPVMLKGRIGIRKWLSRPYWEQNVSAVVTASPSKLLYLYVLAWSADQTGDPSTISANVTLYMDVIFWDRVADHQTD